MTPKILVIEDVYALRSDMVEMLRIEGFDVAGAENGVVGLEMAQTFLPDLVLCDIMMPVLDGYGVLYGMRAEQRLRAVPFIFLTAKSDRTDVRHGMGLGADDYLTKPVANEELLTAIRARLDKRLSIDEMAESKLTQLRQSITTALPHELRTPLNTIIGFSDMLIMEAPQLTPTQVLEWAGHINTSAQRLHRLVENYLTYVRIQSLLADQKRLAAIRSQVTGNPHINVEHQAIYSAQRFSREADLALQHGTPVPILMGEHDLNKVMDEVLDNAFKFSAPGTQILLQTGLEMLDGREYFTIRLTDHGRGMTPEQIRGVGAYMQFDRLLYEQQGSGLGLAIARGLTEMYDGTIQIDSEPGTYMTVTLAYRIASH